MSEGVDHLHNRIPVGRRLARDFWRQTKWWYCVDCDDKLPDPEHIDLLFGRDWLLTSNHGGTCDRCSNQMDKLYIRSRSATGKVVQFLCEGCCLLERKYSGRMTEGRHNRGGEPLNQPPTHSMFGKPKPCEWCGQPAQPSYVWEGRTHIFCGWAHAGLWMDQQMGVEQFDEAEAEAYVRRSLGITDG